MSIPPVTIPDSAPKPGTVWRHYKGHRYVITAIGQHTFTGVLLVVYMDGDERTWCRPLSEWRDTMPGGVLRFTEAQ